MEGDIETENGRKRETETVVHTADGSNFEVAEYTEEVERIMCDSSIELDGFIRLTFPDGCGLYIKKGSIIAFYAAE